MIYRVCTWCCTSDGKLCNFYLQFVIIKFQVTKVFFAQLNMSFISYWVSSFHGLPAYMWLYRDNIDVTQSAKTHSISAYQIGLTGAQPSSRCVIYFLIYSYFLIHQDCQELARKKVVLPGRHSKMELVLAQRRMPWMLLGLYVMIK